jgi:hypothetical protein
MCCLGLLHITGDSDRQVWSNARMMITQESLKNLEEVLLKWHVCGLRLSHEVTQD